MTDTELLNKIKIALGITGTYQDETLLLYVEEVKNYLIDAGVSTETINSSVSVGVITRGVSDLWNYGPGSASYSEYFLQRALQLKLKEPDPTLNILIVTSEAGSEVGTTKITAVGASSNNFRYYTQSSTIALPEYGDNLSDWTSWNGTSEIKAENRHYICIAEVDSKLNAIGAGTTRVVSKLG